MASAFIASSSPTSADMVRDTLYHGADVAGLFDAVVEKAWLERLAKTPKHRIIDALLLLAVEHADQLPAYLDKLAERRATRDRRSS